MPAKLKDEARQKIRHLWKDQTERNFAITLFNFSEYEGGAALEMKSSLLS